MIPAATWYRHIARHKGRALALLRAAERLGVVGVRTLVESWGLVWGADVMDAEELPDPKPGELPTAADVLRQRDRADRRDRADFWRRAFAQLDIEAEAKRFAADPEAPEFRRRAEAAKRADQRRVQVAVEEAAAVADDGRAVAREEFLRRRRIANAERADDRAAALARVRERSAASAQE